MIDPPFYSRKEHNCYASEQHFTPRRNSTYLNLYSVLMIFATDDVHPSTIYGSLGHSPHSLPAALQGFTLNAMERCPAESPAPEATRQNDQSSDRPAVLAFSCQSHDRLAHRCAVRPGGRLLSMHETRLYLDPQPVHHHWRER